MKIKTERRTKKFLAMFLAVFMMLIAVAPIGMAAKASDDLKFDYLGSKTAEALAIPGQYDITLSVPGALQTEKYSEYIVMVDASISQGANLNKLKETLVDIAEQVLHNDGSVRMTLMGFGMGPATVGSFYNAKSLKAYLADVTQADLRQGVSATNCEAALKHVREYIENSDKLNKTCVIFTSDGMTNMDEMVFNLLDWDQHPEYFYKKVPIGEIIKYYIGGQADLLAAGYPAIEATTLHYPEETTALGIAKALYGAKSAEYKAAVDAFYAAASTDTVENSVAYIDDIIKEVMRESGIDVAVGTTTSKYEKAFLNYAHGVFLNGYLCSIHRMKDESAYADWYNLSTWGARAADEADKLCENDKVLSLYMLDFASKKNTWMDPASATGNAVTSDKITYLASSNYGSAIAQMRELSSKMFKTTYNDTTIIDPMSKWVDMIPSSIRIYKDDKVIWTQEDKWLVDEDERPTASDPVKLEDTNGDGLADKLTWLIKDGPLYYTDRYSLKYTVDVDETVEGFQYDTLYPANDPTKVTYIDENDEEQEEDIKVPDVQQPSEPDDFKKGDFGMKIYKASAKDKTPISDISFKVYSVVPDKDDVLSAKPTAEEYSKYATDDNLIAMITTNASGYTSLNLTDYGYGKGFYLVMEMPSDKVKAPVDPFYVQLPMGYDENGEDINVVTIYPKNVPVDPEEPIIPPDIPEDPKDPTTGKIKVLKHRYGNEQAVLANAEFQLYKIAETEDEKASEAAFVTLYNDTEITLVPVVTEEGSVIITTGEDGYATTAAVPFGLYFLVETKAPVGYMPHEDPIAVWATAVSELDAYAVKVPNRSLIVLPETGGMGTMMFTMTGMLFVGLGIVMMASKMKRTVKDAR